MAQLKPTPRDWHGRMARCRKLGDVLRADPSAARLVALAHEIEQQLRRGDELTAKAEETQRHCAALVAEIKGVVGRARSDLFFGKLLARSQSYRADDLREEARLCQEEAAACQDRDTRREFLGQALELAMMSEAVSRMDDQANYGTAMAQLPTPEKLRDRSLRCREAAKVETDASRKKILANHASTLAQLAEHIERRKPVAADVVQGAIESSDRILAARIESVTSRRVLDQALSDYERQVALGRVRVWRQKAEECRAAADQLMFRETRATYRRLADTYDTMADAEEAKIAGTTKASLIGRS